MIMPWFESTVATLMIVCSIVGAATIGVFIGVAVGRRDQKEWLALKEERIIQQTRSIELYKEQVELCKVEAEFYKGLYTGNAKPGETLNG
jgi:hypothetical protein